ncbi:SDR family oxidoreductase [Dysgonomonas sp. HDW5A]|uniref:SDR family oxidoreductase n=1 Tax=Dysgonomonas sp. HDW5A TaxID=2714926 RepID=UPI00140B20A7|nr:SDR family oxidoreductase [Dysgonomonas sp. HDW5A]QIK60934.1 SDR family oxidoreductase [Dysgonomonas sp. HDW5A]
MKILLTGATGYIAQRLLPVLVDAGHTIVCCVRDVKRFHIEDHWQKQVTKVEVDFLKPELLINIPSDIDVVYYLIHSMSTSSGNFSEMEQQSAQNFVKGIEVTDAKQIIYLSGIVNDDHLSKHLQSRKNVETILSDCSVPLTTLKAGIIVGSGSASFEIMRDLVEKLPIMIAPRWLKTRCQPIAIRNVIQYLSGVLLNEQTYHQSFDIGGPDVLTFKQMLLQFAEVRKLKRHILVVPLMTPNLSSYWLYFVTSTNFSLAKNLVKSMSVEVICQPNKLGELIPIKLIPYNEAIELAFDRIDQNQVLSSWTDALTSETLREGISAYISVPQKGCFHDKRIVKLDNPDLALDNIFAIGGKRGWYYANWLWAIRGLLDKMVGGTGIRRGRKNDTDISPGEALDFWRILVADKDKKRLLLYAEMKLPGEAWLEFKINAHNELVQTATFRPLGLLGRLYWYSVLPFHAFIFKGMAKNIATKKY